MGIGWQPLTTSPLLELGLGHNRRTFHSPYGRRFPLVVATRYGTSADKILPGTQHRQVLPRRAGTVRNGLGLMSLVRSIYHKHQAPKPPLRVLRTLPCSRTTRR